MKIQVGQLVERGRLRAKWYEGITRHLYKSTFGEWCTQRGARVTVEWFKEVASLNLKHRPTERDRWQPAWHPLLYTSHYGPGYMTKLSKRILWWPEKREAWEVLQDGRDAKHAGAQIHKSGR